MSGWQARERCEKAALAALVRAAEALLVPTVDGKAAALIWAGKAIMLIAKSDPRKLARDAAIEAIEALERMRAHRVHE